jgi:hypothetical protein
MKFHTDKTQYKNSQSRATPVPQKRLNDQPRLQFVDNRPGSTVQRRLQEFANISLLTKKSRAIQRVANPGNRAILAGENSPAEVGGAWRVVQMAVEARVGRYGFESTSSNHAEELLFASGRFDTGNFTVDLNAWPCTGERGHDCHNLFITKSSGRTITVNVTDDHGGYAANHGLAFGSTGTITYANGAATIAGAAAASAAAPSTPTSAYDDPSTSSASKALIEEGLRTGQYPPKRR